eukprot:TRINITY_DN935_c0_g1_i2.p1 TRINITY_DN935_c0_g1~~TRINITY_DN935_c0_g1_i2.p1  ORF type:complete len:641 (+),score=106.59 TRINITY_DN935_c0_g1_i2:69-1991(+)
MFRLPLPIVNSLQRALPLPIASFCANFPAHQLFLSTCARRDAAIVDNDHSRVLFTKLAQKNDYKYLDPDIHNLPNAEVEKSNHLPPNLIRAIKSREENPRDNLSLKNELDTFKNWALSAQLQVGFLLHMNENIHSKQYLTKLIKVLASGDLDSLKSHEFIALLLLIYFRRDMTLEEFSEYADIEKLQTVFGNLLFQKKLSPEEIVAGCLGFKKIAGCGLNLKIVREALYESLDSRRVDQDFKDFYLVTIMTALTRGNMIFNDAEISIFKALKIFEKDVENVSIMTAIKMMSFGISLGLDNENLSEKVYKRLATEFETINGKDVLSVTNFLSKTTNVDELAVNLMRGEVSRVFEEAESVGDIGDVLKSLSYLAINEVYRLEVSKIFLDAFVDVLPSEVSKKCLPAISKKIIARVTEDHRNRDKILSGLDILDKNFPLAATICQQSAALCFNMRIDKIDCDHSMDMDTAAAILKLSYKKIPLQLHSPQMSISGLDYRSRQLVNCKRGLAHFLGSDRFIGVARLLPHFPEPDLVFGVVAGTPTAVPDYLTDPEILRPKRGPPGEWWVLVMGTKNNMNSNKEVIGVDRVKVRQLKMLGFNPIVVPSSVLANESMAIREMPKIIGFENVYFPNLDDGYQHINRKF